MSVIAKLQLKSPEKELGKWEFVSLPKEGDYLGIRVNDEAKAFRVEAIIHSPVMWPAVTLEKVEMPSVLILLSIPDSHPAGDEP